MLTSVLTSVYARGILDGSHGTGAYGGQDCGDILRHEREGDGVLDRVFPLAYMGSVCWREQIVHT